MQRVHLKLKGDEAWPELDPAKGGQAIELPSDNVHVAFLDKGTSGGQPVVLLRADDEGTAYIIQLTGRSFQALAGAFHAKYKGLPGYYDTPDSKDFWIESAE